MVKVELFGSWLDNPVAEFRTIDDARHWAESYGSTANWAEIYRGSKIVGRHYRDFTGDGLRWFAGPMLVRGPYLGRYRRLGVGPFVWRLRDRFRFQRMTPLPSLDALGRVQ